MDPTDVARVMGERIRRRSVCLAFAKDALAADVGIYVVHRAESPLVLRAGNLIVTENVVGGGASASFTLLRKPGDVQLGTIVATTPGLTAFTPVSFGLSENAIDAGQLLVVQVTKAGGGVLLPTWSFNLEYDLVTPT